MRTLPALVACAALAVSALAAAATKDSEADLVANVEVLALTRVKSPKGAKLTDRFFHSWVRVDSARKGEEHASRTIVVEWLDDKSAVPFLPKDRFTAYLSWDEDRRVYKSTWIPNQDEQKKLSDAREYLPKSVGQVVTSIPRPKGEESQERRAVRKR